MPPEEAELRFARYKARPLNGIWASPPYLRNGSVPSLRDLLNPQQMRPSSFVVNDACDPEKIGLDQTVTGPKSMVYDDQGLTISGNWNGDHEYATAVSDDDNAALIEYLSYRIP